MLKRQLREYLVEGRLDDVAALARERTRVLGLLMSLTFDSDHRVAWRAVDAMGGAAAAIAEEHPGAVREHLRRLIWLITEESGGICWRAPEAMAEILARCPTRFPDFVPVVVHLIQETAEEDLEHFRAGMLWAIGRLGALAAPHVGEVLSTIVVALDHADPQVRGTAAWALGRIGRPDLLATREALRRDEASLEWYAGGDLTGRSVADLTAEALSASS